MNLPPEYEEKVYAGVLGKIIGVYLGRPFEGWSYERIMAELGEINYYVHEKRGVPLIVTDDDISGTFTFLRALPDHGNSADLTAEQIGRTWLNYLIELKTILWWGGIFNSTEHTAYLRLKHGIPAPHSGSIATNGRIVAEQIGAQIFIDGWAMVAPGNPKLAAELARKAASVSHDGEAIYGAQCLAAMEAQAFVESDIDRLIDSGLSVIPPDSVISRMIGDIREWYARDQDWRTTFGRIQADYGYDKYIGNCHMVPNHALIILGLLYGQGDFQKALMVCNTCGWDTDCNSGNLGCLMGIRNGLAGFEGAVDWRGPVADRLYLPTMDGGRCVTDAVQETYYIVNSGRALAGLAPLAPKGGARFHFELPGSLQGFRADQAEPCAARVELVNVAGLSRAGQRSLALRYECDAGGVRVTTPTFILPEDMSMPGYSLIASPTIYPGQTIRAALAADEGNAAPVEVRLLLRHYNREDQPDRLTGPGGTLAPGACQQITWTVPELDNMPIFAVGVEIASPGKGSIYLDSLTWDGVARTTFSRPGGTAAGATGPQLWRMMWVNAVQQWDRWWREPFRLIQNEGRGLITSGLREWRDYRVSAALRPAMCKAGGLAIRVQGQQRYYALELSGAKSLRLMRMFEGELTVLAEMPFNWQPWQAYPLMLEVRGERLTAWLDDRQVFEVQDAASPLLEGAFGLVVEEGHIMTDAIRIEPA